MRPERLPPPTGLLRRLRLWLIARVRARRIHSEMTEEFAFHVDMERRKLAGAGRPAGEAHVEARRRFGNIDRIRAECHTQYLGGPAPTFTPQTWSADMFWRDVRHAVRTLAKQPSFTLVVAGTLALGIGATTAVFSVLNSVILSPLPYYQPDRLVRMYSAWEERPAAQEFMTAPDFVDFRDKVDAFEELAALYTYRETGFDLTGIGQPQRIRALRISSDYFDVYRTTPLLGRTFTREEELGSPRLVILSHHLWQEYTDSDGDIVGTSLTLDGSPYTVVGVMRPNFMDVVAGEVDVWFPQNLELGGSNHRHNFFLSVIGRLRPGVTLAQAQAELDVVNVNVQEEIGSTEEGQLARLYPLHEDVTGNAGVTLYVLMGAAALVLLIACVNVANLFLARGVARQKEFAIRAALGSGRGRLVTKLLTESLVLATLGGVAGLAFTYWGVKALLAVSPQSLARADEVSFDPMLLAFTGAVTLVTALMFGLAPAVQFTKVDLNRTIRDGSRGTTGGVRGRHVRAALVASQISLALILLVGAGILMKGFAVLQRVDLGIDPQNVATFEVHLPAGRYDQAERRVRFHQEFHQRLRSVAGVRAAGAVSKLPASGSYHTWGYRWQNADGELEGESIQVRVIQGDYFDALGIGLVKGRAFTDGDRADTRFVAIINQSAAQHAFGDGDPLGRQIGGVAGRQLWEVVGVARDVSHTSRGDFMRKVYLPHAQFGDDRNWALTQVVATTTRRDDIFDIARRELAAIDAELVVHKPQSMDNVMEREIAKERFSVTLMSIFAAIALTLAVIGIYGVLSYTVNQRTQEIGIRIALGAHAPHVRRIVAGQAAMLAAVGISVGLAAAYGLTRLLASMVFEVSVTDPAIFAVVPATLGAAALLAGYLPARRATRVDPMEALRGE